MTINCYGRIKMADLRKFLYCFFMTLLTLIVGAYFNYEGVNSWYQTLEKPVLTPPDQVFPIAWGLIYLTMVFAFYFAFKATTSRESISRTNNFFINQLFLHILWNFAFFYTGYIALALLVLIVLDIVVFRTIYWFFQISPVSAWLLIPYQAWLLFATWLNAGFVYLHGFAVTF